jgi:guanylate kinase
MSASGRLVILTGPSCVGKSPLDRALGRLFPELRRRLHRIVLYNDRPPRPGEVDGIDYHFRPRSAIEAFREHARYAVMDVRGDLQALDLDDLASVLGRGDAFFEGNPFVGGVLVSHPRLTAVPRLSCFLAPLTREEILAFQGDPAVALPDLVTDLMRRKLLRRAKRHRGALGIHDLEVVERRAGSAYRELREAWRFNHVIPNHDGEDSEHWDAFPQPVGDARRAVLAFAALLRGETPAVAERWHQGLLA